MYNSIKWEGSWEGSRGLTEKIQETDSSEKSRLYTILYIYCVLTAFMV
jgi:hypothetical protein